MRLRSFCLFLCVALGLGAQEPFLVKPYLQLGNAPKPAAREQLDLLWHAADQDAAWSVELKGAKGWQVQAAPTFHRLAAPPLPAHRVYRATLKNLAPGARTAYRVKRQGQVVFEAEALSRKPGAHRMVVLGDAADGSANQAAIAKALLEQKPDGVMIVGDLVYGRGRASEYRQVFFPIYNAEATPLMRQVPVLGLLGNHDVAFTGFEDAAAYFAYWSLPLNGPALKAGDSGAMPTKAGVHDAMVAAAGSAYPRMAHYSFDWGFVHWTVLDSNPYVDWSDAKLRTWLEADLKAAQAAPWRVVALHHPLFQSSFAHAGDQWMRPLAPLFEKYGVSLVLAGHVHNYQRTAPLRFAPGPLAPGSRRVEGAFTVDEAFDGRTLTRAAAPIYIVSGAGGADLYDKVQTTQKETWQSWTRAFISDRHSFTVLDVEKATLRLRQLDERGKELDAITLTR